MRLLILPAMALAVSGLVWGQGRVVRATGNATISVKPDQVKVNIGVSTTADTAQAAAAQNASQMDAVLARLKQVLGSAGDTRTVNYSITPNYRTASGQAPVLTGFTASNTVEVTTSDLSSVGALIDAATQAGANNVGSLQFLVKDQEPVKAQALAAAAKQARSHADSIASGIGGRVGSVIVAQEGATVTPVMAGIAAASTSTPIDSGLVQVYATVSLEAELL